MADGRDRALQDYAEAIQQFELEGMNDHLRMCLQNVAWVHCETGQTDVAWSYLERANPLCGTTEARWHQQVGEAYLQFASGQLIGALERCGSIDQSDSAPQDVRALAAAVAATAALSLGQVVSARRLIAAAMGYAQSDSGDSRCLVFALRISQKIAAQTVSSAGLE